MEGEGACCVYVANVVIVWYNFDTDIVVIVSFIYALPVKYLTIEL